ncbi:MAG TPA: PDZ domain-containing protein [Terriglobales bacterium]|nr:PDZ domain-containing protein [Terriglobales bacterium]
MKHIYITGLALLACACIPLSAQKTTKVHRFSGMPVVADFETAGRSYLGVGISDLSSDRVQALKLKDDRGVEITSLDQDAPAGKAGLKQNDVIVGFNGTRVESAEQFKRLMRETPPGRTVSLDIMRDGQQQNIKVQLADRKKLESSMWPHESGEFAFAMPPVPPMPPMPAVPAFPRMWDQTIVRVRSNSGATVESLSPQLGDYFGVKNGEGLLVRSVQKGSAAESAGLHAGDVIVRVGDQKISDSSDWSDALRNAKTGKVPVVVIRDKKEQTLTMTVPPRRGPDSSALYREQSPGAEMALDSAAETLDNAEPLVEDEIENGLDAAAEALTSNGEEIGQNLRKTMQELHRQLIDNRGELTRNIAASMKIASAELKAHSGDIQRAMREAQRAMQQIHIDCKSEMQ